MKIKATLFLLCIVLIASANSDQQTEEKSDFALNFNSTTLDQWPEVLANYRGKILVVDMWATWCSSCIERFPHMVEMSNKYQTYDVAFISLLLEDPEESKAIEKAKRFLIKQKADFAHYFMNDNLMQSFEQLDLLGIPAVIIYDQTGQQTHKLTGDNPNKQFTEQDIYDAVNGLIVAQYKNNKVQQSK